MKAARATGRLRFDLTKRIPLGGGLGGGSSNAASVLLALPALLGKRVPLEKLMELAAELGSDVPFFLPAGPPWASDAERKFIQCRMRQRAQAC